MLNQLLSLELESQGEALKCSLFTVVAMNEGNLAPKLLIIRSFPADTLRWHHSGNSRPKNELGTGLVWMNVPIK